MRLLVGIAAAAFLAACGAESASVLSAEKVSTPVLPHGPNVSSPVNHTERVPLEPGENLHAHEPLVGARGNEIDPDDLEPLVNDLNACGANLFPLDFINEARALQLGRAKREENELKIGNRSFVDYGPISVNGVATTHDAAFIYFGSLKRHDLDLIYVNQPEETTYMLFDARTSTAVSLANLPVTSPSGRYLVALGTDGMNFVGVHIVERSDEGVQLVKQIETATYPCGLKWLSDTRATFQELKPAAKRKWMGVWHDDSKQYFGSAYIELRNGSWIYEPATD